MTFKLARAFIAFSSLFTFGCGGSPWSPTKENVKETIRSHAFFTSGSKVNVVSFDESVQRYHVFSLTDQPKFEESFPVPQHLKVESAAIANEQSRVIAHPNGNYFILIRGAAAQVVSSRGESRGAAYTMPRRIVGYNFLADSGRLLLRDEVGSISSQIFSDDGTLIERWEKGPLIGSSSTAGALKSTVLISDQVMVALSSNGNLFEVNLPANANLDAWKMTSLSIPAIAGEQLTWILGKSADKTLLVKTANKAILYQVEEKLVLAEISLPSASTFLVKDLFEKQFAVIGTAGDYQLFYVQAQSIIVHKLFTEYQNPRVELLALDLNSSKTEITSIVRYLSGQIKASTHSIIRCLVIK